MDNINSKSNIRNITDIQKLKILIKKELWEHSFGLFKAPIALLVISLVIFYMFFGFYSYSGLRISDFTYLSWLNRLTLSIIMSFFIGLMISYFLHCLYNDKKNGSLAFFRSIPYSDSLDLVSKLIVGFIIIPITFYLYYEIIWFLESFVLSHVAHSMPAIQGVHNGFVGYGAMTYESLIPTNINFFLFVLAVLYVSPYLGYFLFVSIFSKRSPYLLAFIPVLALFLYTESPLYGGFYFLYTRLPISKSFHLMSFHDDFRAVPTTSFEVFKNTISEPSFWYCIGVFFIFAILALAIRKKSDV